MDIDDILTDLNGHGEPQETRDLQELTRAWVIERSAPEILPWPESLMDRMMERIRRQVADVVPSSAQRELMLFARSSLSRNKRVTWIPKPTFVLSSYKPSWRDSNSLYAHSCALGLQR